MFSTLLNSILGPFSAAVSLPSTLSNSLDRLSRLQKHLLARLLHSLKFLPGYYRMNDSIWQEGLLVDWLQKKVFDKWVRRFLVHSAYLVSERVVFDIFVRFYIDYVIWPSHRFSIFDFRSVASLVLHLLVFIMLFVLVGNLIAIAPALI